MARTVEAILRADVSGFNTSISSAAGKVDQLGQKAVQAGAKIDAGLAKGGKSAGALGTNVSRAGTQAAAGLQKATAATSKFGASGAGIAKNADHLNRLGRTAGIAGAALVAGIGLAVKSTADFDQAMSHVSATGQDFHQNLGRLREAAISAGAATSFSAKEAANAEEELAKAGVSAKDVLGTSGNGALVGALKLAEAGSLGVADAANIAATAMVQFEKRGTDVGHIADLLAAGAGKAQGSVADLGLALNYVGPVAHSMGVSMEQTVGVLAEFASAGLVGEKGGTALRGVLLSLVSPSKVAADTMKQYGINLYDAQGAFVGVDGAAQQLHDKLNGLGEAQRNAALGTIFGNAQITAATVLMKGGAGAVDLWTKKVNDAGFAGRVAAEKMNNLRGDLERLSGSFQTALIQSGEGATGGLRGLVKAADSAVNSFNHLSPATKSAGLAVAAIGGAGLLSVASIAKLAVGVSEARAAMAALRTETPRLAGVLGGVSKAATVAAGALIALEIAGAAAKAFHGVLTPNIQEADRALTALAKTGEATDLNKMFTINDTGTFGQVTVDVDSLGSAFQRLSQANWADKLNQQVDTALGTTETTLTQLKVKFDGLDQSLIGLSSAGHADAAAAEFRKVAEAAALQGFPVEKLIQLFPQYAESVKAAATASGRANLAGQELADAMGGKLSPALEKAMKASGALPSSFNSAASAAAAFGTALESLIHPGQLTVDQSQKLSQSLFAEGDAFQSTVGAHSAYAASLDSADSALGKHSLSIDKNTHLLADNSAKQRDAVDAVNGIASAGKAYVQSLVAQGASASQAASATAAVREQFVKAADAAGLTAKQANHLADQYGLIPDEVTTEFQAFGLALQEAQVKEYGARILALPKKQQSEIIATYNREGPKAALAELNKLDHTKAKPSVEVQKAKAAADVRAVQLMFAHLGHLTAKPNIKTQSDAKRVAGQASHFLQAIKDKKPKIVTEKNMKAAEAAVRQLKAIKDAHPKVVTEKQMRAAEAAVRYLKGIRDKSVAVKTHAEGVGSTQSAINSIHGKTVTVFVRRKGATSGGHLLKADGGYIDGLADGGPVRGRGGRREDNIAGIDKATGIQTSNVSVGEFVQPADSVDYYGLQGMQAVQEKRIPRAVLRAFANGGYLSKGGPNLASGGTVPQSTYYGARAYQVPLSVLSGIVAKLRALSNPLASVAGYFRQVTDASAGVAFAQRALAAVQRRSGHTTEQVTVAQDRLKAAQDRLVQSNENLGQAQATLADSIRSTSATLRQTADTTSTDPADVLAKRRETAESLAVFNSQLLALRKAGLNDQDLTDLVGRGVLDGSELAANILKGGRGMVYALNLAQKQLQHAADAVGITTATGVIRRASGGWIDGSDGREDKLRLLATRGEYVVEPRSARANADLLERINASQGRNILRGMQAYGGSSSSVSHSTVTYAPSVPVTIGHMGVNEGQVLGKLQGRVMDALTMTGLAGVAA